MHVEAGGFGLAPFFSWGPAAFGTRRSKKSVESPGGHA
jgi:hypothetical protein